MGSASLPRQPEFSGILRHHPRRHGFRRSAAGGCFGPDLSLVRLVRGETTKKEPYHYRRQRRRLRCRGNRPRFLPTATRSSWKAFTDMWRGAIASLLHAIEVELDLRHPGSTPTSPRPNPKASSPHYDETRRADPADFGGSKDLAPVRRYRWSPPRHGAAPMSRLPPTRSRRPPTCALEGRRRALSAGGGRVHAAGKATLGGIGPSGPLGGAPRPHAGSCSSPEAAQFAERLRRPPFTPSCPPRLSRRSGTCGPTLGEFLVRDVVQALEQPRCHRRRASVRSQDDLVRPWPKARPSGRAITNAHSGLDGSWSEW